MAEYNYAEAFQQQLLKKYAKESCSDDLTKSNSGISFLNAQTIKLPNIAVSGYKDHTRTIGFNSGTVSNSWTPMKLEFDRDIEFFLDPLDVDETNLTVSIANIQNIFEEDQAIPEKDCYRFSKLHAELSEMSGRIDTTVIDAATFLDWFDGEMALMDEAGVPEEGRILYVTPTIRKIVKEAEGLQRFVNVSGGSSTINRGVHSLDDVTIKTVPAARMKTVFDFTVGFKPAEGAKQINCILIHTSCVVCRNRYSYIKVFTPGHDSRVGDGYLYQNRNFGDLFLLEKKKEGCSMNISV